MTSVTTGPEAFAKPPTITAWSDTAFELLHTLTQRVPILSEAQAIHALKARGVPPSIAAAELDRLREAGWLQRLRCTARWPVPAKAPRFCWSPGDAAPSFAQLRAAARRATTNAGLRSIALYVASRWSANLFAVAYRGTLTTEMVPGWIAWAQIYLQLLDTRPDWACCCDCRGIPAPGDRPRRLPACLTIAPEGVTTHVLALLNYSSLSGLQTLHETCLDQNLSYQLW